MVNRKTAAIAATIILLVLTPFAPGEENSRTSRLWKQLQSREHSNAATKELIALSKSDPSVKQFLIPRVAKLIETAPDSSPGWTNAVHLAGFLRIKEAIPGLTKWLSFGNVGASWDLF